MISDKVQKSLNGQINMELYSSYLYLSMASHFQAGNLNGFSNWMKAQAKEELLHAMKLYEYLLERGGNVALARVDAPPASWATPLAAFEDSYRHECENTKLINDLMGLAIAEHDHATAIFLQWFVTEQVEEESSASQIVEKLRMAGGTPPGLLLLDRELSQRM
ncbi:MAG: ferritin [bacterium]